MTLLSLLDVLAYSDSSFPSIRLPCELFRRGLAPRVEPPIRMTLSNRILRPGKLFTLRIFPLSINNERLRRYCPLF